MAYLVPVVSSSISAIGWDQDGPTLYVKFRSGSQYAYSGVPEDTFRDFLEASSKGKFFARFVRDKYPTQRI